MSDASPTSVATATGSSPTPAAPPAPVKVRDPWFDNAKMALVVLVVVGHAWTLLPLLTSRAVQAW